MPENAPLTAAGPRQPKGAVRIPSKIRNVVTLMVYGRPSDPNCAPLDFIEAAKECGVKPDVMRRWLDRPQLRAHLFAERRAFRAAINAGNEGALRAIRDTAANSMSRVAAVRALEQLDEADMPHRPGAGHEAPGVVIVLQTAAGTWQPYVRDTTPTPPAIELGPHEQSSRGTNDENAD